MKTLSLVIVVFLIGSRVSTAVESTLCDETMNQVQSTNTMVTCGIGEALMESMARQIAFDNAKSEFNNVCSDGTVCGDLKYSIEPKQVACAQQGKHWKCYRVVVFKLVTKKEVTDMDLMDNMFRKVLERKGEM